ncbi:MAG: exosortase C-terminal domain/associated protein EpsI [Pseudomonadota bacterium]
MPSRRDIMLGLGCAGALGAAEALRPRSRLTLMPAAVSLSDLIPGRWPGWHQGGAGDIVIPQTPGSLSSRLYREQLARVYRSESGSQPDIMLLIAYGGAQSDGLQLHRPEACYPAVGFEIDSRRFVELSTPGLGPVPAVALTARSRGRVEDIIYWTRVGRSRPRTSSEQTLVYLRQAMQGYVGDGVLVRASAVRGGSAPEFGAVRAFLESMVAALSPGARAGMIGA